MPDRVAALVAVALLAVAGCGLDDTTAGVEVVAKVSDDESGGDAGDVDRRPVSVSTTIATVANGGSDVGEVVDADRPGATLPLPLSIPRPGTVVVIGDSLTLSAEDEIDAALTRTGLEVLTVDGLENRRMVNGGRDLPPGIDVIDSILEFGLEPELWIIALGTNDVGSGIDERAFRDDVAEILTRVPPGAPVIWVDLWIRDRVEQVAEANAAIRSVSAIRPNTLIVDWYGHGDDPGVIIGDGVHLSDAGQVLFADTMAAAVDAMFVR